jgi:hypothetical protein
MAQIIPDRIPSGASRGERRTFDLLKKLPDDYLIYYEPNIKNRRPDFIVIAPDLGVIVIEVKGWSYDQILKVNDKDILISKDDRETHEIHPLEQARKYQWRLVDACVNNPKRSLLFNHEGIHKNKFSFPFCHFVILSNISRDQIERQEELNLYDIFKPENTLYRDQLKDLELSPPEKIQKKFMDFFDPWWPITPLTEEQVDVLRSIIHPEIVLSPLQSRSANIDDTDQCQELKILDRKQENNARRIGEGHRIIYGVAGSGKTVILIARSKWLHDENPSAKILLVCYNFILSVYLKHVLEKYPRIQVFHFDGWAKHNGIIRQAENSSHTSLEGDVSLGKRLLEYLKQQQGDFRKYDAILVDEAQDFPPIWFSCILEALTNPDDGDLLIVCDGNQGIRLIDAVSWKSLGIKAQGRTIHQAFDLDRNYRNTREILKLASHFTVKNPKNDEDSISIVPVDPDLALRRGARPILYSCKDRLEECEKILKIIKQFLEGKVSQSKKIITINPPEIGILYVRKPVKDNNIFQNFLKELRQITSVTWLSEDYYSRLKVFDRSIKIQTVASSKGLQYRLVIIMWADLFEPHTSSDFEVEQRRLYVALTRASDILIITYSRPNEFIERMITSGDILYKQISTKEETIEPKKEDVSQKIKKTYSQEAIRAEFPNAYALWSLDDDERLTELYQSGKTVKELVQIFQRNPGAIQSRLKKLKLKK